MHQIRDSLKYVSWSIYFGGSREGVRGFSAKWGKKYPHVVKSWETNWEALTAFFRYPLEIRRVMYTTNIIESVNSKFKKVTAGKRIISDRRIFVKIFIYGSYGAGT